MKKTLSLLLALVMVLGTFSTVFAVMPETDTAKAELLRELGVLRGDGTDLNLEEDLKRRDAVVLLSRLMKAEELAKGYPSEDSPFDDITDAFYDGYIAWAYDNKYTKGVSETKFDPNGDLTAQQFATFLLRALGYEVEGEAYDNALKTAKDLGLLADVDAENETVVKRSFMAVMTFNALYVPMKDSEVTLGEYLELELPQEEPEVPAELEAEVVTDNLKSFTVVFNQPVKSAKVTTGDYELETTKLSDDKTTLVGVFKGNLDQSTVVTFTINAETEDGLKLEDFEVKKTVNDVTIPVALSAKALNPRQIEVLFSEPVNFEKDMQLLSNIEIDGEAVVAETSVDFASNKLLITLYEALTDGTKTLKISKIADFAGFAIVAAEFDILVVEDNEAPVAIKAEVKDNRTIVVTFDEPIVEKGIFEVVGNEIKEFDFVEGSKTQIEITLEKALGVAATVEVTVRYKGQTDVMGNEVKDYETIKTRVEDDITLPEVVSFEVKKGNKLVITFSKPMTENAGEYQILDKDEDVVQEGNVGTLKENKTVLEVTILEEADPTEYTLKLTDMVDASIRTNPLATYTKKFTSLDTLAPKVDGDYKWEPAEKANKDGDYENKITIYFTEEMDKETVENLANYLNAERKPLHTVEEFTSAKIIANRKGVTITYVTEDKIEDPEDLDAAPTIIVLPAVKDLAGNLLKEEKYVDAGVLALDIDGDVELTAADTIKVTFEQSIQSVYTSLFKLQEEVDGTWKDSNIRLVTATANGKVVTFKTSKELDLDGEYRLVVVEPKRVTSIHGLNLNAEKGDDFKVKDKVVPTLKVAKYEANAIKFTFSREVKFNVSQFINNLYVDGDSAADIVTAVYDVDDKGKKAAEVTGTVYGKVFIVKLDVADVAKVKVGFPTNAAAGTVEASGNGLKLKSTGYLEVK